MAERIRIEIGFDSGQGIAALVDADEADSIEQALAKGSDGIFTLEAEDGQYTVVLKRVVYLKRYAREAHVGFGAVARGALEPHARPVRVGLEVGIVGLPNAGKTTLFNALTRAGADITAYATVSEKPNVGMAPIADDRLGQVARGRGVAQGDAGSGPRRRCARHRRRAARQPPQGGRAARGARRVVPGRDPGRRPRDPPARAARRRPRPRREAPRASALTGEVRRGRAARRGRVARAAPRACGRGRPAGRLPRRAAGRARAADHETVAAARERPRRDRREAGGRAGGAARGGSRRVSRRALGAERGRPAASSRRST